MQSAPKNILVFCLLSLSINCFAEKTLLEQDRYYLESDCPIEGIQELKLNTTGSFILTTYISSRKKRRTEFEGDWQLTNQTLQLSWADNTQLFEVRSKVHEFLQEKFLYLSFKAIPVDPTSPLYACEFVDRRVVDHFFKSTKKN